METRDSGQASVASLEIEGKQRAGDQVPPPLGLSALKKFHSFVLFIFFFLSDGIGELGGDFKLNFLFFFNFVCYYFISGVCVVSLACGSFL